MTLTQLGSAAGAAALARTEVPRQRTPVVAAERHADADSLLESVRRGLLPGDPVARLLARWPAPPVRAVEVRPARRPGLLPTRG